MYVSQFATQTHVAEPALLGAVFWCCASLMLAFHRTGVQIVGAAMSVGGLVGFLVAANAHVCALLFFSGAGIHFIGRALASMRQ